MTLDKVHILKRICSDEPPPYVGRSDYFHLGHAIIDPPAVRGSIVLELDVRVLYDNVVYFDYGSPVDLGSIHFGFLKPAQASAFEEMARCDHSKFVRIIRDLARLPPSSLSELLHHRGTPEAAEILARYFDGKIITFMTASRSPAAWMFEFCLRGMYKIDASDVQGLHYPNTYAHTDLFKRLKRLLGRRVRMFNPRFGIESI